VMSRMVWSFVKIGAPAMVTTADGGGNDGCRDRGDGNFFEKNLRLGYHIKYSENRFEINIPCIENTHRVLYL